MQRLANGEPLLEGDLKDCAYFVIHKITDTHFRLHPVEVIVMRGKGVKSVSASVFRISLCDAHEKGKPLEIHESDLPGTVTVTIS